MSSASGPSGPAGCGLPLPDPATSATPEPGTNTSASRLDAFQFQGQHDGGVAPFMRQMPLDEKKAMGERLHSLSGEGVQLDPAAALNELYAIVDKYDARGEGHPGGAGRLGGGRDARAGGADGLPVSEGSQAWAIANDVRRAALPGSHPDHLPFLLLKVGHFNEQEVSERLDVLLDLIIDYNRGQVFFDNPELLLHLHDAVYSSRDFTFGARTATSASFDMGASIRTAEDEVRSWTAGRLQELGDDRALARGLPKPETRQACARDPHLFCHFDQRYVSILEITDPHLQEEMKQKMLQYRSEGWKTSVARIRLLTEEGVMSSESWEQGFLPVLEPVGAAEVEENLKLLQRMRQLQESSPHERLRNDPRFTYARGTTLEHVRLRNFRAAGVSLGEKVMQAVHRRGDTLGCAYPNCQFSSINMAVTGLSPGVWGIDPLFSDPQNPMCCGRHLLIADFLTVESGMNLKRELAVALMSMATSPAAGDDGYLDRILLGGCCGTYKCAAAGVYGSATRRDPSAQGLAVCDDCHAWWEHIGMPAQHERGRQALREGRVHAVDGHPSDAMA